MYIRRKVFSTFINEETGEERLFSTTEIDGAEVKEFSDKEKPNFLKYSDLASIRNYRGQHQEYRDEAREMYTTGKSGKNIKKERAGIMAGVEAGRNIAKSLTTPGITPITGVTNAAISAALGAGEGLAGGYVIDKYRQHKLKKNPKAYEKKIDQINVAEGKMSEEEFAKKYYKKYKK